MLGTVGGIGLMIGPAGLLLARWRRDPELADEARLRGMDAAFIVMLFLTSATGLALLALRDTAAMGILLALHLGVVLALFITMPYGKFVHGIYRFLALVRYAKGAAPWPRAAARRAEDSSANKRLCSSPLPLAESPLPHPPQPSPASGRGSKKPCVRRRTRQRRGLARSSKTSS